MIGCVAVRLPLSVEEQQEMYMQMEQHVGDLDNYIIREKHFFLLIIEDTQQTEVWQKALNLECEGISVGYAWADSIIQAVDLAKERLKERTLNETVQ